MRVDSEGFLVFDTAIGHCGLAWGPSGLIGVLLPEDSEFETRRRMQKLHSHLQEVVAGGNALALEGVARICNLLQGVRDDLLDLPLDLAAVPFFHQRVYRLVRTIEPGSTATYGEIAARLGEPSAARAVGQALSRNPFAPVVPCHRVLAAAGRTGGFGAGGFSAGGGVGTKLRMLQIEGARLGREPGLFD